MHIMNSQLYLSDQYLLGPLGGKYVVMVSRVNGWLSFVRFSLCHFVLGEGRYAGSTCVKHYNVNKTDVVPLQLFS